jgi:hypothetical protein
VLAVRQLFWSMAFAGAEENEGGDGRKDGRLAKIGAHARHISHPH